MNITKIEHVASGADRIDKWVITARTLASQVGCEQTIEPMLSRVVEAKRETINVAVVGSPNSGKSSRLNALLGRKILPVSGLASNCTFFIQPTRSGEDERFSILGISGSLADLASAIETNQANPKEYRIHVASDWLSAKSIRLLEKPALDATDEELDALIEECLREVDLVVLLIDALMPVKRSELKFMNVCAQRKLPIIVAMSKGDKVPDDEREVVMAYVAKHVESCEAGIPVIDTRITSTLIGGIDELKQVIEHRLARADLDAIRREQIRLALLTAINIIMVAARTGNEAQSKSQAELDGEIKQRQQQLDTMSLEWIKLEQALHQKRQSVDDQIRTFIEENQNTILEGLFYDLERNNDIKTWWQRDLPFRLQRELKTLAGQLSASINMRISNDVKWLQEELLRRLKFPLQALAEPTLSVRETELTQTDLSLSDSHRFKIISRLGTAASVIMAGSLLATAGVGGIALAASALAGLTAEQVALYNTRKDRGVVRDEIQKLVQQASHEYTIDISRKLKAGYDQIISGLKQHQERWQQAQVQSLIAYTQKNRTSSSVNWQAILGEIRAFNDEVKAHPFTHNSQLIVI